MSTRSTMQGDGNPGGRARRESGRETEGDRHRKSLRHGWARLPGDGSLSGKALKFETAASELFPPWEVEARRPWTAHSLCGGISSRKHLLSSSFCWFLGFQPFKPRVDINHCVSVTAEKGTIDGRNSGSERTHAAVCKYWHFTPWRRRLRRRGQPLHRGYCEGFNFFFFFLLPTKTDE